MDSQQAQQKISPNLINKNVPLKECRSDFVSFQTSAKSLYGCRTNLHIGGAEKTPQTHGEMPPVASAPCPGCNSSTTSLPRICCSRSSKEPASVNPNPGQHRSQTGRRNKGRQKATGWAENDAWACTSLQEAKQLLLTHCSSSHARSNSHCARAGVVFGGEQSPRNVSEGARLHPAAFPPPRRGLGAEKPVPHPLCSSAVQKAAGSCREPACLACRRERRAKAPSRAMVHGQEQQNTAGRSRRAGGFVALLLLPLFFPPSAKPGFDLAPKLSASVSLCKVAA